MEDTSGVPSRPWETSEYDWIEVHATDPEIAARTIMAAITKRDDERLLTNAEEVRDRLLITHHTPPPDINLERAGHFLNALGIYAKPSIIFDTNLPADHFTHLLEQIGIRWRSDGGAQFSREIDASIIYPPQLPHGVSIDDAEVHEGVHSRSTMPGHFWNEGLALLIQDVYSELDGRRARPELSSPYSAHKIGLLALSNICEQHPTIFEKMLAIARCETVETHRDLLAAMYQLMSPRRFWHLVAVCDPDITHDSPPAALRGIIDDESLDNRRVPFTNVLAIVKGKLAEYEAATGYRFNFPQPAVLAGTIALQEAAATSDDAVLQAILRVTQTMTVE